MNRKLYYISLFIVLIFVFKATRHCILLYLGENLDGNTISSAINFLLILSMFSVKNRNWRFGLIFILISSIFMHIPILLNIKTFNSLIISQLISCLFLVPAIYFFIKNKE